MSRACITGPPVCVDRWRVLHRAYATGFQVRTARCRAMHRADVTEFPARASRRRVLHRTSLVRFHIRVTRCRALHRTDVISFQVRAGRWSVLCFGDVKFEAGGRRFVLLGSGACFLRLGLFFVTLELDLLGEWRLGRGGADKAFWAEVVGDADAGLGFGELGLLAFELLDGRRLEEEGGGRLVAPAIDAGAEVVLG